MNYKFEDTINLDLIKINEAHTIRHKLGNTTDTIDIDLLQEISTFPIIDPKEDNVIVDVPYSMSQDELIEKLVQKKYNIKLIPNLQEEFTNLMTTVMYNRLLPFIRKCNGESTKELIELYEIEQFLHEKLVRMIPPIENNIKNSLITHITSFLEKNNVEKKDIAFLYETYNEVLYAKTTSTKNYKDRFDEWAHKVSKDIKKYIGYDTNLQNCVDKYNGSIPIWFIIDKITLGNFSFYLTTLNKDLMKEFSNDVLNTSSENNSANPNKIYNLTQYLTIIRNTVDHSGNLLFNKIAVFGKKSFNTEDVNNFSNENKKNLQGIFWGLFVLKYFYIGLGEYSIVDWNNFIKELSKKISNEIQKKIGFPDNWEKGLLIIKNSNKGNQFELSRESPNVLGLFKKFFKV